MTSSAPLRRAADTDSDVVAQLQAGDELWLLDCTRGWAWGYGGRERRVGYVAAEAVGL